MKRFLAITLVAGLTLTSLVGCGKKETVAPETSETQVTETQVTETEEPEVAEAEEAVDWSGQTLRIMMSSGDFGADTIKPALEKAAEIMGITIEYDVIPDDQMFPQKIWHHSKVNGLIKSQQLHVLCVLMKQAMF